MQITRAAVAAISALALIPLVGCSVDDAAVGAGTPSAQGSANTAALKTLPRDDALAAKVPAKYRDKGTLILGLSESQPYSSFEADGSVVGLVPDLAKQLESLLGLKITVTKTSFDAIVPGIKSARIDLSAPAGDFVERQTNVDFADFAQSNVTVMTNKSGKAPGSSLDLCGTKAAVEKGTGTTNVLTAVRDLCTKAGKPPVDLKTYNDLTAANLALQSNRVDSVVAPTAHNQLAAAQSNGTFVVTKVADMQSLPAATATYGIQTMKDSGLAPVLVEALQKLDQEGVYTKLFEKWNIPASAIPADRITLNGSTQKQKG
jgi:polar amino acid transport system substrate-binding protein